MCNAQLPNLTHSHNAHSMLAGLLAPLPVTRKNPSLQLILMSGQIKQEQGHRCHFVVDYKLPSSAC